MMRDHDVRSHLPTLVGVGQQLPTLVGSYALSRLGADDTSPSGGKTAGDVLMLMLTGLTGLGAGLALGMYWGTRATR